MSSDIASLGELVPTKGNYSKVEMDVPETHVLILMVAGVGLVLVILYEIIRMQMAKCRGDEEPEQDKSASCQKLEEPPPSYESLFP